jgi:hypothetical protein
MPIIYSDLRFDYKVATHPEKQPQSVENSIGELVQWRDFLANENRINRRY